MINRIKISIVGKNPDYFLKELIKRNINIYKTEKNHKELRVIIDYQDLEIINSIKTTYKLKIIERYGLSKYKYLLKKYFIFILFLFLGVIINIILSNMIFEVKIVHSNKELVQTLQKDLKELGLKKYRLKISYSKKEQIKEKLLSKEKDLLEWLEIEERGTKYIVKVEQRKKNKEKKECNPRHIVAKKNALVKEITASAGEIVKKKNDYVEQGEVLISGLIHNKEDVVSKRCTVGKVYGEVWYNVRLKVPKVKHEKKLTNEKSHGFTIKIFNKEHDFLSNYRTYDKKVYNIIESKIVPINFGVATYYKTEELTKKVSLKSVDELAIETATERIQKKLKKNESIISKKVLKKTEINSKIEVEVFFKVKENITAYLDITDLDIEELNKKEEWLGARSIN